MKFYELYIPEKLKAMDWAAGETHVSIMAFEIHLAKAILLMIQNFCQSSAWRMGFLLLGGLNLNLHFFILACT
jgi:hypothetical protein